MAKDTTANMKLKINHLEGEDTYYTVLYIHKSGYCEMETVAGKSSAGWKAGNFVRS